MDPWGTDQQNTSGLLKPTFELDANDVFGISWTVTNREELKRTGDYDNLDDDDCTFFLNLQPESFMNILQRVTAIRNLSTFFANKDGHVVGSVSFSLPFSAVDRYTFTIKNLPAGTHLGTLLGSIRNVGRIYASKVESNVGNVTFAERASADRFWKRHRKGLLVGSTRASVSRHVNPTAKRDTIPAPQGVSRAIKIVGHAGFVNRERIAGILNNNTHGRFDTEYVTEKTELVNFGTVEWVFGSCKQANLAHALIEGVLERFSGDAKSMETELAEMGPSLELCELADQLIRVSYAKDPSV